MFGIAFLLVLRLFFSDLARLARFAVSYMSSSRCANCAADCSSVAVASSSKISMMFPSRHIIDAVVLGLMPVVSSIGEKFPLDGLRCLFIAPCTSGSILGH